MVFSSNIRSSTIYLDKLHRIEEEEEHGLNTLNNRFANYLHKIKILGDKNINLRRQIDDIYRKYMGHIEEEDDDNKTSNSFDIKFHNLHGQLNNELEKLISIQIRLQRADHDEKYYKNKFKFFSTSDQTQIIKQQLDGNVYELNFLKEQYVKQEQNLRSYKRQYNEYMTKLMEYTNEYNNITSERIESENCLYTLKEQLAFEREYTQQCKQEFEFLEKSQYQFNKTEFENTIEKIRQDYQKYNEVQLSELEILYKIKLDSIENHFYNDKNDNHSEEIKQLIEQNRLLQQKLKQLENDLYHLIEHNRQQYEKSNHEYEQLENQLPEFESFILNSRNNTLHLTSEINTYQCLLINLTQNSKSRTNDFTVHFGNGIIWVRI